MKVRFKHPHPGKAVVGSSEGPVEVIDGHANIEPGVLQSWQDAGMKVNAVKDDKPEEPKDASESEIHEAKVHKVHNLKTEGTFNEDASKVHEPKDHEPKDHEPKVHEPKVREPKVHEERREEADSHSRFTPSGGKRRK